MSPRYRLAMAACTLAVMAACGSPLSPEVVVHFTGVVELPDRQPATIDATAHRDDDCYRGEIVRWATTLTDDEGRYSFSMPLPEGPSYCVAVVASIPGSDGIVPDTVTVSGVRPPELEDEEQELPPARLVIRIVIPRPGS